MDINMPLMDGVQTREKIVEMFQNQEYPIMPYVIAYTANGDTATKTRCKFFDNFLCMGCSFEEIRSNIVDFFFNSYYNEPASESDSEEEKIQEKQEVSELEIK